MEIIPCLNWTNLKHVLSPNPGDDRGLTRATLIGHGGWTVDQSDAKQVYTHTHTLQKDKHVIKYKIEKHHLSLYYPQNYTELKICN